tara:strand:+ start:2946 stop:4166 length:1221 start_codon:yes stop_codon:yes gene_type:complete
MIQDYINIVAGTFKQRKVRTILTMLGIFVGIAAIVSLIALGQGFERKITEEFEKLGSDKLMITPKAPFAPPGASTLGLELTKDDEEFVRKINGVEEITSYIFVPATLEFNDETRFFNVFGMPVDDGFELWKEIIGDIQIEEGRQIKQGDKFKIVIGNYHSQRNTFSKNVQLRNTIKINDVDFKVVGIWEFIGSPEDDKQITMPIDTAREVFDIPERVDAIIVRTAKGVNPSDVAATIKRRLRKHRGLDEGKEDFRVQSFEEVLRSFNQFIGVLQVVLVAIAGISLLVGGIGIMNTMYTSVLERTREIGVMKAIGARNGDIIQMYLIESGFLGIAGGVIGILIGVGISKGIELIVKNVLLFEFLEIFFPWYLVVGTLLFSFVVGALSGVLPAIHAANQKPVDALRYE